MEKGKNLIFWCGDAANQRALAFKIHERFGLAAIVLETGIGKQKHSAGGWKRWVRLMNAARFFPVHNAWRGMLRYYNQRFPGWPDVPIMRTGTINDAQVLAFSEASQPDLIIVSGTTLIKEPTLNCKATIGIINLHTGLSPYVKGGPNCTNWCIANNEWELIGNTIMWINAGIDTGNIITTEQVDVQSSSTLLDAHILVMEKAHDLYLRAIKYLVSSTPPYTSVSQKQIAEGKLFYSRMWNQDKMKRLLYNWKKRNNYSKSLVPRTVSLPEGF